jgi:hypothetical protein
VAVEAVIVPVPTTKALPVVAPRRTLKAAASAPATAPNAQRQKINTTPLSDGVMINPVVLITASPPDPVTFKITVLTTVGIR